MTLGRKLLITVVVLYCCCVIFKLSIKAGFFFIPLLLVLPPLISKGSKAGKNNRQERISSFRPIRMLRQCSSRRRP